tara:strand:- start:444 stop:626 length:183 start_codon:yes stop_codon:yes gene_type:complete
MNENESEPQYDMPPPPPLTDEMKIDMFKNFLKNPPNEEVRKQIEEELAILLKNNTKLNNE